jgi:hypothetical protein
VQGQLTEGSPATATDEARLILDIFASVDALAVDVTWTNSAGDSDSAAVSPQYATGRPRPPDAADPRRGRAVAARH